MATVYQIKVKTVSPWCAFTPEQVENLIADYLDNYRNDFGVGFECTEVEVMEI